MKQALKKTSTSTFMAQSTQCLANSPGPVGLHTRFDPIEPTRKNRRTFKIETSPNPADMSQGRYIKTEHTHPEYLGRFLNPIYRNHLVP